MVYPDEQLNVPTKSRANSLSSVGATTSGQVRGNDRNPGSEADLFAKFQWKNHQHLTLAAEKNGRLQWKKNMESQDIPGVHFKEGFEASFGYMTICSVHVGSICSLR